MPELPEVETIARRLREVILDRTLDQIEVISPKSFQGETELVIGSPIKSVQRKAKQLRIQFSNGQNLGIHLKMTGQLIFADRDLRVGGGHPTADWVQSLPSKHTRIIFKFVDGSSLYFNDQRLFGWVRTIPDEAFDSQWSTFPPDAHEPAFSTTYLAAQITKKRQPIKLTLLDSTVVGGIGNIYVCDALNVAQIHPVRPSNSLSRIELEKLVSAIHQVIGEGIERGGTTFDGKYVDVAGFAGGYQNIARVYGREGEQCFQCGGTIVKTRLNGRGTYFCQNCQQ